LINQKNNQIKKAKDDLEVNPQNHPSEHPYKMSNLKKRSDSSLNNFPQIEEVKESNSKDNSNSAQADINLEQKKLPVVRDKCVNHKLELGMKLAGYREISTFAKKTPFDRTFISKILHGHIKPTINQAQEITNVLNLRVQDIFDLGDIRDLNLGLESSK